MNKQREYGIGREDGLSLAYRIVREGGIEALEKELKFRNVTGIHTSLAAKDLNKASEKIKEMTLDTFTILELLFYMMNLASEKNDARDLWTE